MPSLVQSVLTYVRKHELLHPGDRVGLAVSGGADSVGLLRILLELRRELGVVLSLVHLNHSLRGAESDGDEQFVRELAQQNGLELFCETRYVKAHAAERKLSLEAAARKLRYDFFQCLLQDRKLDKLATAHTLDDQAETVLLKLLRGAGTRGLAGIYPRISIQHSVFRIPPAQAIVRPLLAIRRAEIEAYLRDLNHCWREDSSNRDLRHMRNRIRHQILPALANINADVCERLAETAEIARAEEEFWSQEVAYTLPRLLQKSGEAVALRASVLTEASVALQRRLLRAAAQSLGLTLEFRQVEQIRKLTAGIGVQLSAEWSALRDMGTIRFERNRKRSAEYEYRLPVPGSVEIAELGSRIEAEQISGENVETDRGLECLLDVRFSQGELVVRNWRPGDRFWPAHTKAPKKMKELLQDRHITGEEKKVWPVIASGDEIIWVRGFGVRRDCQSKNGSGVAIREVGNEDEHREA